MTRTPTSTAPSAELFSPAARLRLHDALMAQFNAYLKPNERLRVNVELEQDYVYAQLLIDTADRSFRLDLESAVLVHDQDDVRLADEEARLRLEKAFAFLRERLSEFFLSGRRCRFHVDWRIYEYEDIPVRFRGRQKSPQLEAMADSLLGDEAEEPTTD